MVRAVACLVLLGLILPTMTPIPERPVSVRGHVILNPTGTLPRFDMGKCSDNDGAQGCWIRLLGSR